MRGIVLAIVALCSGSLYAQLSNDIFRMQPAMPESRWGTTFEATQFLKNNEYFNHINPGETIFGFQVKGLLHYRIQSNTTFSTGVFLQKDFGDAGFFTKAIPIFNFQIKKNKWVYNLGNIQPHIFHNLPEPMLNYENLFMHPVELGLQAKRQGKRLNYDAWLEWRQKMDETKGRQEMIIFGQSLEENLVQTGGITLSIPAAATIYHQGGQGLAIPTPIATRINTMIGLRFKTNDSNFFLENLFLNSLDNSPTPVQPYKNGWASMTNLRFRLKKYHQIALTWWYANEFQTTLGNTMFTNVNLKDPYLHSGVRRLAMLRYVFSRPIAGNKLWMDFRVEPYYDLDYKKTEFSSGLFFRYVSTLDIKKPRWMGGF